jgi:hypothetical protein
MRKNQRSSQSQIDWSKLEHVKVEMNSEETSLILKLKSTNVPLPRVTIITEITNALLFQFCVYSWKALVYPPELLNWVLLDNNGLFTTNQEILVDRDLLKDTRIRTFQFIGKYDQMIEKVMKMDWISTNIPNEEKVSNLENILLEQKEEKERKEDKSVEIRRGHVFTSMICGDILYPDTLIAKHRAMTTFGKECVCPDILGFFNPVGNVSVVAKLFPNYPESGLYWKKSWWTFKSSSKVVGLPYIGNCVTIGHPTMKGIFQPSSIRFFEAFPDPIKKMIKSLLQGLASVKDENNDSDDSDEK